VQRLRDSVQERKRGAVGHQSKACRYYQRRQAGRTLGLDGVHALHRCTLRGRPVSCFLVTPDHVVLHSKDLCIGCGYCFYACPFGAPQYPQLGNFGSRGKMDKCTFCAGGGGTEEPGSIEEYKKYGANRLLEGKLPLCAEMCSTKSLLAGDSEIIAQIYKERVCTRGYGSGAWGWLTAYHQGIAS
jgi:formate dehydrogenase iron-sulfur subunit